MEYIFHIIIMLNIYIMLVLSANLTIGVANLLTIQGVPSGRGQTAPESPPAGFHMIRCGPCS